MLEPRLSTVLESRDRDGFRHEVIEFGRWLGFDKVSAMVVVDDDVSGKSTFVTIDNTPGGYRDVFVDASTGGSDPVMHHCRERSLPIVWNQDTYVAAGKSSMWEHQAAYGYRHGIAVAMHLPQGRHFFIGVDRDQPIPSDTRESTRLVGLLQLFLVHAQEVAWKMLGPAVVEKAPRLSPRELEALRRTMAGKTAQQVGDAMHISERTAALHLIHAIRKLRCANKVHAVVKAIKLGLIQ
jgi:DNA-binding CsgD family transcriptional regulator